MRQRVPLPRESLDIFKYYDRKSLVVEVEASGKVKTGDNKSVCSDIKIIRVIPNDEIKKICNLVDNTGLHNSGNWNSGNWNSGYGNSGDRNSGNWNSGHGNSENRNSGNDNSGYGNSGFRNSGHGNSGHDNSGHGNSGDRTQGTTTQGTGTQGTGTQGTTTQGTGTQGTGTQGTGTQGTGTQGTGTQGTGTQGTGTQGTGTQGSGTQGTGTKFVIQPDISTQKKLKLLKFSIKLQKVRLDSARKPKFIFFELTFWIDEFEMSEQEKIDHPKFYCQKGYLKNLEYKEAWKRSWDSRAEGDLELLEALPNFNWKVFTEYLE